MKVGYDCEHAANLVTPAEMAKIPVTSEVNVLYPLIDEHPVEIGDRMTCVTCSETRIITKIYDDGSGVPA